MPNSPALPRRRWLWVLASLVVVGAVVGAFVASRSGSPRPEGCTATDGPDGFLLDLPQAANAATIAAVAQRMGLPPHAVTIALATALQESKLRNLSYGDRDSVGLFQQRPSQGWGSPAQLSDPHYAARAFYSHLQRVRGWQRLPVAVAAQAVQRSADGSAYAPWEPAARITAKALTGGTSHGLTCAYNRTTSSPHGLQSALDTDLGAHATGVAVEPARGWAAASWLVAQAAQYGIETVTFDGLRWTRAAGEWRAHPSPRVVTYSLATSG